MTIQETYNKKQSEWKQRIKTKPKRTRWLHYIWYLIAFPFVWLFYNIRDWRSAVCVVISLILWSASVWIWYLLAIITGWTTDAAKWFLGIGSAVWIWWLSPVGSPFILLVTITSIGMKTLYDKLFGWKRIVKKNGGCYINGKWFKYYNGFLYNDYVCLKLKKWKGMTYENKTK